MRKREKEELMGRRKMQLLFCVSTESPQSSMRLLKFVVLVFL